MDKTPQGGSSPVPILIDVQAAALHVGVGVGVIRSWVRDGLPFVRGGRGGKKLFARRDLEKWVERMKESTAA